MLHVHTGNAGVAIGEKLWQLYNEDKNSDESKTRFYNETSTGEYKPRAFFADMDPHVITSFKTRNKDIDTMYGKNCSYAFAELSTEEIEQSMDIIRKQMEATDRSYDCFLFFSALGGGSCGLYSRLVQHIAVEYPKRRKISFDIFPSKRFTTSSVESYNTVLGVYETIEHIDSSILMDNSAVWNICQSQGIEYPTYNDLNNVYAHFLASLSDSTRIPNNTTIDISELHFHNLPYPRIHYLTAAYCMNAPSNELEIMNRVTQPGYCMSSCNITTGRLLQSYFVHDSWSYRQR
jgi:hypothetical protein